MVRYSLDGVASSADEYDSNGSAEETSNANASDESGGSDEEEKTTSPAKTRSSSKSIQLKESKSNLEVVDLVTPMPPPVPVKKRRGRPPKAKSTAASSLPSTSSNKEGVPKRGRGRPPKSKASSSSQAKSTDIDCSNTSDKQDKAKRGPGRPRKAASSKATDNNSVTSAGKTAAASEKQDQPKKRGRGRPRKHPKASSDNDSTLTEGTDDTTQVVPKKTSKKKRGRPPKNVWAKPAGVAAESDPETPMKRGRPKRGPLEADSATATSTNADNNFDEPVVTKAGSNTASYNNQDVQPKKIFTEDDDSCDKIHSSKLVIEDGCDPTAAKSKSFGTNSGKQVEKIGGSTDSKASTEEDKARKEVITPTTTLMRLMKTPSISNRRKKSLLLKALAECNEEEGAAKLDLTEPINAEKEVASKPSATDETIDDMKSTPKEATLLVASGETGGDSKTDDVQANETLLEAKSTGGEKDAVAFEEKSDDVGAADFVALSSPNVTDRTPARRRASSVNEMRKKSWAQLSDDDNDSDLEDEQTVVDIDVAVDEVKRSFDGKDMAPSNGLDEEGTSGSERRSDEDEDDSSKVTAAKDHTFGDPDDAEHEKEDSEDDASDTTGSEDGVAEKTAHASDRDGGDGSTTLGGGDKLDGRGYVSETESTTTDSMVATNEPRLLYDAVVSGLSRVNEVRPEEHEDDYCEVPTRNVSATPAYAKNVLDCLRNQPFEKAAPTPLLMHCLMGGQSDVNNVYPAQSEEKKATDADHNYLIRHPSSVATPTSSKRFAVPEDSDTDSVVEPNKTDLLAEKLSVTSIATKKQYDGRPGATPAPSMTRFTIDEDSDEDIDEEESQVKLSKTSVNLIGHFATPVLAKKPSAAKENIVGQDGTPMASNITRVDRQFHHAAPPANKKPPLPPIAGKVSVATTCVRTNSSEDTASSDKGNGQVEQTPVASNTSGKRAANHKQPTPFNAIGKSPVKPSAFTPSTLALFGEEEEESEDEESRDDKGGEEGNEEFQVQNTLEGESPVTSTKENDPHSLGDQLSFTPLDASKPGTTNFATPGLLVQFCEALNSQSKGDNDGKGGVPNTAEKQANEQASVQAKKTAVLSPELTTLSRELSSINMKTPPPEGGATKLSGENMRSLPVNNCKLTPQVLPANEDCNDLVEEDTDFDTILTEKMQLLLDLSYLKSGVDDAKYTGSTTSSQQVHRRRVISILNNPRRTEDLVAMCLRNNKDIEADELIRHFDYFSE